MAICGPVVYIVGILLVLLVDEDTLAEYDGDGDASTVQRAHFY